MHHDVIAVQLEGALRTSLQAPRLRLVGLDGERPPAETASAPWSRSSTVRQVPAIGSASFRRPPISSARRMQCIFDAAFPLAYFARINANIERLLDLYE